MGYSWNALSYQEKVASGGSAKVLGLSLVFVFLILAALYESWSLPFSVLLSTPVAVLGAYLGLLSRHFDNNVYAQIGLVMLVGLTAKNAILIVEFAKDRLEHGRPIVDAALEGARLRLRPILMTSFAFIFGCVPLWIAKGAGAAARQMLGHRRRVRDARGDAARRLPRPAAVRAGGAPRRRKGAHRRRRPLCRRNRGWRGARGVTRRRLRSALAEQLRAGHGLPASRP